MNKPIKFLIILFIFILNAPSVFAVNIATPKPTIKPSSLATPGTATSSANQAIGEKLNVQINQLKERIASRVAELNLVEKRGVIGTVTETSGNQIAFKDLSGKTRYIDVDEITKFSSPGSKDSFGLSDMTKGIKISTLGLYNKQTQRILARFIETFNSPVYLSGRIADINQKNFTVTIIDEKNKQTRVDIQTVTKISIYTAEDGISKHGFSKLEIGDNAAIYGFPDKNDPALISATRFLLLNELPKNPNIIVPNATEDENTTVTPTKTTTPSPAKQ
jgi:hypothetical protein